MPIPEPVASPKREWNARLELEYERFGAQTVLTKRAHVGPLRVQRPFIETSGVCQTYVIHPPGGIVGGDVLDVQVHVQTGARALLTTPGATKFYRSVGEHAHQNQHLRVAASASVEWFPQETIVFDEALAHTHTRVDLSEGSRCALWEITCLGRTAGGKPFTSGCLTQRLELHDQERPLLLESLCCDDAALLNAPWGFRGLPVYGTLLFYPASPSLLATARASVSELWSPTSEHLFGASQLSHSEQQCIIVCRYLGTSAEFCKALFTRVWQALRPHLLGIEAEPPRVWRT